MQKSGSSRVKPVIETSFGIFATHSETAIKVLNQIYKDASDDRLSKVAGPCLQHISAFISANQEKVVKDSKITLLAVYVLQSLQWAVDCDPEMIKNCLAPIDFESLVNAIV